MMLTLTLRIILLFPLICTQRIHKDGQGIFVYDKIELRIYENATVGSVVLPDLREYLQISPDRQVRLGPGAFSFFFSLTENHSLLVQSSLDLESGKLCRAEESCCRSEDVAKEDNYLPYSHFAPSCKLRAVVLANNGESTPLKPIGWIVAAIQDLNDHAPEFVLPKSEANSVVQRIHISFIEGFKGVGEKFQLPTAKDKDFLPENSMVTYSIAMKKSDLVDFLDSARNEIPASSGSPAWVGVGPFRLMYKPKEDCLTLEVAKELDRESQSEYELALEAEDGEGQKAILIIQVHVLDVNEYEPRFVDVRPIGSTKISKTLDYNRRVVKIYENATVHLPFIQVIAEDKDAPPANQIAYKFSPSFQLSEAASVFSIDSNTGKISLERPLDFEETKRYVVTVQATDANCPISNSGDKKVLPQSLQKVTEAITSSITKEPKTATMTLEIVVNDCNDHAPEIKLQGAVSNAADSVRAGVDELTVMENAPPGTSLVFFSATDRDQGDAGVPQCHLLNWTEKFRIYNFPDFFSLETTKELDREIQPQYLLTIECYDNGNPRQYSQKQLRVSLLDVNDEAPSFQHPFYSFHLLENSPPRTKLIPVSDGHTNPVVAFDKDINSTLTYHLEPITTVDSDQRNMFDYQLFDVDADSGTLITKGKLDREQKANHKFNLCADDGIYKACTSIVVHLDDVNDNPPLFERETYIIRIVENTQFYEPLITFHVTDVDTGNQGFSMAIEAPQLTSNASDIENITDTLYHFSIRDNKLFLRQPVDREAKSHYHFFVRVTDLQNSGSDRDQEGLSSTAEVFIEVCDTNDNAPIFVFPNASAANEGGNQLNVSCRETMGSSVGRIVAIDLDLEQNGTVVYSVIQGPVSNELFYLDKQSGELFVNSGRLSENCDSVFLLVISADDMGPPSSKMGRPIPVERLLVRLQDQPTLAEYMSLNSQQPTNTRGRNDSRGDKKYFGLPAKTVLSVVLGGCIVFLTGLFLAWLILTLISRSKRRRRERREETPCQAVASQCCEASTFLSGGKHEIFVHPAGIFPHGLGLNGNRQFLQCTLGEKDEGVGLRELDADGSVSSGASPYGQGLNVNTNQSLNTGGFISHTSTTTMGSHISRSSPMNYKTAVTRSAVEAGWNKVTIVNTPGTNATAKLSEEKSNFVVVPGDAVHVPASACSGGSTRYLLFPALSTPSTAMISVASTSHTDTAAHSLLRPNLNMSADSSFDPRRRSQCVCEEDKEKPYQNSAVNISFHPFLTPPLKRKSLKPRETDEVLENVHFMFADNQYTPLAEASTSSQVPCENQYLIITSRGTEIAPVYNTIGRTVPRGSSLPSSLPGCSWSLERVSSGKQAVLNHIDEISGVLLAPSVSSPSHSPNSALNNSVRFALHPKSIHRFEDVNPPVAPATAHLRADYISLEDLFSSCV
ncbi:Protocadherin-16 [Echinococcus granulosus]|uniref:Protocadherin-16 n=1 Tax=Echinococcus granulosus TaxID=6210 RepID=W6U7R5_ECHGR|nr:Protocadherin-16 [Echinococcus granulosus]EUB57220.1 Protocadherin-16 [Echinococcus granulosus]